MFLTTATMMNEPLFVRRISGEAKTNVF